MEKRTYQAEMCDGAFLFVVTLLSSLPYVLKLGFYADDWAYQAALVHSSGQGIGAMIRSVVEWNSSIIVRPVQTAYLVLSFEAFGRHAVPYHLFNSALLGFTAVLLYLAIKELKADRWLAFVIALVFGLLPHYSTDRFWIAAHQATLSMTFAFAGIYALLRSVRPKEKSPRKWVMLAVVALVLSILSYEVALGLLVVFLVVLAVRRYLGARSSPRLIIAKLGGIVATIVVLLLVGIIKVQTQTSTIFPHRFPRHFIEHCRHVIVQAVRFNFWTYCLDMPVVLFRLYKLSALNGTAVASAAIIFVLVTVYLWRHMEPSSIPSWRACLGLLFLGLILFGLGCALFFADSGFDFSSAGIKNRTAIASALGASCVLVAMVGLMCSISKSQKVRIGVYSLAIGLICGANCLVVSGIGFFGADATSQQSAILNAVARNVRSLPAGSVLLLDGFCRYSGPAVIFEDDWDTSGAIQLDLNDASLRGDVISRNMRFNEAAVETTMYGGPEAHYAYGDHLFVYNVQKLAFARLPSQDAANVYFRALNPSQDSGCRETREGDGERVF